MAMGRNSLGRDSMLMDLAPHRGHMWPLSLSQDLLVQVQVYGWQEYPGLVGNPAMASVLD